MILQTRASLFLLAATIACAEEPAPVVRLFPRLGTPLPFGSRPYLPIPLAETAFKTAAAVRVVSKNGSALDAQRNGASVSAVYGAASLNGLGPKGSPAGGAPPPQEQKFDFKLTGDSGQGWATMTSAGMPFLEVTAFGDAWTEGSASWTALVNVPAVNNYIFVKFTLPKTTLSGDCEGQGPSAWRSRLLADLLLNGHPVWSTESLQFNQLKPNTIQCEGFNGTHYSNAFGQTANLSAGSSEIILSLGKFPAGQIIELGLSYRLEAKSANACKFENAEFFCSRATASTEFNTASTPVTIYSGPAVP